MTEIDIRIAAQKEVLLRKNFGMTMLLSGLLMFFVVAASAFGLQYPIAILAVMVLMYFFIGNKKETERLAKKYEL